MPSRKLINYIKECSEKGDSEEEIRSRLINAGWKEEQIQEAFLSIAAENTNEDVAVVREKKAKLKIILPILLVLFILGGASAFFLTSDPDPEEEIMQAARNMTNLDSLSTEMIFELDAKEQDRTDFKGNLSITNRMDNQSSDMEVIIKGDGMLDGIGVSFGGRIFIVNDKLFGRLDQFPDPGMFFPLPVDISELTGQYILISESISEELGGDWEDELEESGFHDEFSEIFKDDVDPEVVEDFFADIWNGIWEKEVLVVVNTEDDNIRGNDLNKHSLEINFKNLPDLVISIAEEYEEYIKDFDIEEFKEEMEEFEGEFKTTMEEFEEEFETAMEESDEEFMDPEEVLENIDSSFNVWTDGDYIYRVELLVEDMDQEIDELDEFRMLIALNFSDFNQSLDLEEPEEYMTLEELEEIFMDMEDEYFFDDPLEPAPIGEEPEGKTNGEREDMGMESSALSAYDTQIKSELSQIRSNAEMYYYNNDGSYEEFDRDEGWLEIATNIPDCSTDLLPEERPIEGGSYQINIADNGQAYTAWAPLCEDDGFHCIDSHGNARQYDSEPINVGGEDCEEVFESPEEDQSQEEGYTTQNDCDLGFDTHGNWIGVHSAIHSTVTLEGYGDLEQVEYWIEDESLATIAQDELPDLTIAGASGVENETTYLLVEDPSQGEGCKTGLKIKVAHTR